MSSPDVIIQGNTSPAFGLFIQRIQSLQLPKAEPKDEL